MFLPGQLNNVKRIAAELEGMGASPIIRRIRKEGEWTSLDYSREENEFFAEFYEDNQSNNMVPVVFEEDGRYLQKTVAGDSITALKMNYFKGWACEAGINYYTIWNDGHVYSCEATLLTQKSMGYFYDSNFQWSEYSERQICPVEACVCLGDIQIPKKASERQFYEKMKK